VVAVVAYAGTLLAIGPTRFLGEVLLIGAGVAGMYAVPLPWTAGVAALVGLAAFAARGRRPLGVRAAAGAAVLVARLAGGGDAPSAVVAVRRGAEVAAFALLPLALWGALTIARRGDDATLVASTAVAVLGALQAYPRPDFIHLMPLGVLVLPLALRVWRSGVRLLLPLRAADAVAVAVALVLAVGRFLPTLDVLERVATGKVFEVPLGPTAVVVESAGVLPLRAAAETAEALRHLPADEPVLSFPACGLVLFLADRRPAGPHDYFFPGRPARAEAAALVRQWEQAPPRGAVTCTADGTALEAAWHAYPEVTSFLETRYAVVQSRGSYSVHERRSDAR
jgi:hypothetical protein